MNLTSLAAPGPSPNERLHELATLFATGILRLRSRPSVAQELSPKLSESTVEGLEFQVTKRLSVHSG